MELETLSVNNKKLQKEYDRVMGTEVKLWMELERVQIGNDCLNKHWVSKMKDWEKEKNILVIRNQELQKEMEALRPA